MKLVITNYYFRAIKKTTYKIEKTNTCLALRKESTRGFYFIIGFPKFFGHGTLGPEKQQYLLLEKLGKNLSQVLNSLQKRRAFSTQTII